LLRITRQPPPPPPFPYTTLFRSAPSRPHSNAGAPKPMIQPATQATPPADRLLVRYRIETNAAHVEARAAALALEQSVEMPAGAIDRKSTRLNSTHVKISYAVFCL